MSHLESILEITYTTRECNFEYFCHYFQKRQLIISLSPERHLFPIHLSVLTLKMS